MLGWPGIVFSFLFSADASTGFFFRALHTITAMRLRDLERELQVGVVGCMWCPTHTQLRLTQGNHSFVVAFRRGHGDARAAGGKGRHGKASQGDTGHSIVPKRRKRNIRSSIAAVRVDELACLVIRRPTAVAVAVANRKEEGGAVQEQLPSTSCTSGLDASSPLTKVVTSKVQKYTIKTRLLPRVRGKGLCGFAACFLAFLHTSAETQGGDEEVGGMRPNFPPQKY